MEQVLMQYCWQFAMALVVLIISYFISKAARKLIMRFADKVNNAGVITFMGSSASIIIKILGFCVALSCLGVNISVIIGSLSAVALGLSMALQETVASFFGGLRILFTKPFIVGDYIKVDDYEGTVKEIQMLHTIMITLDVQDVVIPNSKIASTTVTNFSSEKVRRVHVSFPVSLETDSQKAIDLGNEVLEEHKDHFILDEYRACIERYSKDAMFVSLYCYVDFEDYWDVLYLLNDAVQKKRIEKGIAVLPDHVLLNS